MPKDFFGAEIKVGDFVVTPATQGRTGVLRVGVVEEIGKRKPSGWYHKHEVETVTVKRLTFHSRRDLERGILNTRRHHITNFDHIIVVQPQVLPQDNKATQVLIGIREDIFKSKA